MTNSRSQELFKRGYLNVGKKFYSFAYISRMMDDEIPTLKMLKNIRLWEKIDQNEKDRLASFFSQQFPDFIE